MQLCYYLQRLLTAGYAVPQTRWKHAALAACHHIFLKQRLTYLC